MSMTPKLYWIVQCDFDGCTYDTFDCNGEFSAWGDAGTAQDDWVNGDNQVIKIDGGLVFRCDEHRMVQCSECDAPGDPEHPDGFCAACQAEDAKNFMDAGAIQEPKD